MERQKPYLNVKKVEHRSKKGDKDKDRREKKVGVIFVN